jgi:hypothetical protein
MLTWLIPYSQSSGYQYQYWQSPGSQNGVAAAQQVQRGFVADWTVYNSSYMSLACGSSSSNNGYHQSSRLCSATTWPNAMPRYPCYSAYPPAIQDHQAPSYHQGNNHEEDSGTYVILFKFEVSRQLINEWILIMCVVFWNLARPAYSF